LNGVCIRAPQCSLVTINVKIKSIGLKVGFLGFNTAEKKATLYDGGSVPFSTTTLASTGKSVAVALSKPDVFKNRVLYIHSAVTTQRSLLGYFEKHTGVKWTIEEKSTADVEKETNAKLAQGDFSTIWKLIYRSLWGEGYGGKFENVNNEELGIKVLSEEEIEELVKGTL
jgi:ABC-type glycerol-3-phosphate transport system substrate-binding protein